MATVVSKACSACKLDKPYSEFSPDARATTGLQPRCRECCRKAKKAARGSDIDGANAKLRARYAESGAGRRASNNAWRERNRDQLLAGKKRWYKSVRDDPAFIAKVRQRAIDTKDHKRVYDQEYRQRDPQACRARALAWAKRNPEKRAAISKAYSGRRRARTATGVGGKALNDWTIAQPKRCYWCGKACAKSFHVDHYVPLARGGEHELHNLVIACPPCNLKKNAKDPFEFAQEVGRLL
ncbi:HNH endonuclease [Sphingomonas sp. 10B4]|uniref:HNH endonuclease n=1 Tax=Sphingomonas sp. 10B4 TaxID=3048575 RepID=UPI002AB480AA|nr:HNH endonuclease [Sphingomonas sp. 10B4]MDY7525471.1 HNH endonuclease [Sphingomonas sp. 10B4]MEB0281415.1 HNH endonuclease [Sphingomonas sp. 10B4]